MEKSRKFKKKQQTVLLGKKIINGSTGSERFAFYHKGKKIIN